MDLTVTSVVLLLCVYRAKHSPKYGTYSFSDFFSFGGRTKAGYIIWLLLPLLLCITQKQTPMQNLKNRIKDDEYIVI
jgi:hypothetical protein